MIKDATPWLVVSTHIHSSTYRTLLLGQNRYVDGKAHTCFVFTVLLRSGLWDRLQPQMRPEHVVQSSTLGLGEYLRRGHRRTGSLTCPAPLLLKTRGQLDTTEHAQYRAALDGAAALRPRDRREKYKGSHTDG